MSNIQNSKLTLLEHQEEAYNNSIKLMEEKGSAAVIFPTGCGKSFVVLKYILEHPDERILFLSPRNAIKEQMYEYIVRYIGGDSRPVEDIQKEYGTLKNAAKQYIPNIECMLYQTILGYNEKEHIDEVLSKLKPDLIIVDEMHHLKTEKIRESDKSDVIEDDLEDNIETEEEKELENKWGNKFRTFLENNPQAKLLGLSATPIRTDGANVVERIFEDSIASEISLLEAIEAGIIYPPKYIVPDFIREDELKTLLEKIEQADGEIKEQLKEKYDELVKKSANMPGIPELMKEHIEEKDGKYIIFCSNIEDMKEKMAKVGEWFQYIDKEPEIYGIHSKDNTSREQLKQFNSSNSEHLKLMFCVGMIDEGVHLNDVSGVILAAKTGSRPTYLQRIGRCISSGKNKKQTTVIDLVNNNEILYDDKKVQQGYGVNDEELLQELIDWIDEKNNGEIPDYNSESFKEKRMAKRMVRINNKYLKYIENEELLENLREEEQEFIINIIELGKQIGLFEDFIDLELTDEEKDINKLIDSFQEDVEIKGVRKDFREILNSNFKYSSFEEIMQFAKENGRIPKAINKKASKQTEEEKKEHSLYHKWLRSEEKKIVDKYEGKKLEDIPEEHRELVRTIREYGYGLGNGLTTIEEIMQFARENGRIPKSINKKALEQTEEEKNEYSLYQKWLRSEEKKIVGKYEGRKIEDIPEEHRELVRTIREYGYGLGNGLTTIEEIMQFAKENGRIPKAINKKASERTEEEKKEDSLYQKWLKSEEKKIVDKYEEKRLEDIPEKYRELVKTIREYGYGLGNGLTPIEEIMQFARENGRIPKQTNKKASERTEEEKKEHSLYDKWRRSEEKKIVDKYEGKKLEDIPEEHRELVRTIREYGYGLGNGLTTIEEIMQFARENGRIPKRTNKKASERTVEEKKEHSLYQKWLKTEERKIVDKYEEKRLEDIPEEHRELVKTIREYGYGLGNGLTIIEEIMQFAKENGRIPKSINKKALEQTEEEKNEYSLYQKWLRSEEKKIVGKYEGKKIEDIPEEYRELVKTIREYGYYGKAKDSKSLGKAVANIPVDRIEEGAEFLNSISKIEEKNKGVSND